MSEQYGPFSARAGIAAIDRYEEALANRDSEGASAGLAEWLYWWRTVDEWSEECGVEQLPSDLVSALALARNAATHRHVTNGILHSAYPGEVGLGYTFPGQTEPEMAWLPVSNLPLQKGKKPENQQNEREAYERLLARKSSREVAAQVRAWLESVARGRDSHVDR